MLYMRIDIRRFWKHRFLVLGQLVMVVLVPQKKKKKHYQLGTPGFSELPMMASLPCASLASSHLPSHLSLALLSIPPTSAPSPLLGPCLYFFFVPRLPGGLWLTAPPLTFSKPIRKLLAFPTDICNRTASHSSVFTMQLAHGSLGSTGIHLLHVSNKLLHGVVLPQDICSALSGSQLSR